MKPEVAATLKRALTDVVENGTARRLRGSFTLGDKTELAVGGKTGTGDNRIEVFGAGGHLIKSRSVSRTATFVFFIGDRYFGVITASVRGPAAAGYAFTSELPLAVLRQLAPLIERRLATTRTGPPLDSPQPSNEVPHRQHDRWSGHADQTRAVEPG